MSKFAKLLLFLLLLLVACSRPTEISFRQHILPILHDNCVGCHKPGGQGFEKSGLDLTMYAGVLKGTRFGKVIVPGFSQNSTLIHLVKHKADPKINMPHSRKMLQEKDIEYLVKWVEQGAKDN